ADGAAVLAQFEVGADLARGFGQFVLQGAGVAHEAQLPIEVPGDEVGGPARDADVLGHRVTVDARHKGRGVTFDICDVRIELGGDVVAHPFGIHADVEVAQRRNAGAAALGHFFAADGDETVHVQRVGRFEPRKLQHGRPEQGVKVHDILADEVHL